MKRGDSSGDINRRLTHASFSKKDGKPAVVDIETDGLGGPFIYGAYQRDGDPEPTPFYSMAAFFSVIMAHRNRGYTWFAHNGGEYDYRYLIPLLKEYKRAHPETRIAFVTQADRTIGISIRLSNKHKIELRDSYALLPNSLAKLAAALAPDLPKLDIGLSRDVVFNPNNPEHIRYCHRDVSALLAVVKNARQLIREYYGVQCGWTTGATAMRAFRHQMIDPEDNPLEGESYWRLKPDLEQWMRQCYHGGLVALTTDARKYNATCIDVNSMYPSVMRNGVPYGTPVRVFEYDPERPGYYHALATVPLDTRLTFLPKPSETGVLWPRGQFETFITSEEYQFALDHGCTLEVIEGYVFPELVHPFDRFVDKCETLRGQFKGTGLEVVVKLIQNALYGKLATKDTARSYILVDGDLPEGYTPMIDENTGKIIEDLAYVDDVVNEPYQFVHWAAWITAQARLTLLRNAYAIGVENVYYCDTDSITGDTAAIMKAAEDGRISLGNRYGQFKVEHTYTWFHPGAPKFYVGLLAPSDRKQELCKWYVVKCKGVPRKAIQIAAAIAALNGHLTASQFVAMSSTLSELKRGTPKARQGHRTFSTLDHSLNWEKMPNGVVLARIAESAKMAS